MARNSDAIYCNHVIHKVMVIKVLLGRYSNFIETQRDLLASASESTVHVKEEHRFGSFQNALPRKTWTCERRPRK
jgi:hypothetical protein